MHQYTALFSIPQSRPFLNGCATVRVQGGQQAQRGAALSDLPFYRTDLPVVLPADQLSGAIAVAQLMSDMAALRLKFLLDRLPIRLRLRLQNFTPQPSGGSNISVFAPSV